MNDNESLCLIVLMVCVTMITITLIMFGRRADDGKENLPGLSK